MKTESKLQFMLLPSFKSIKLIVYVFFLFIGNIFSQNLVSNPSFEESTACPVSISELNLASPWFTPTAGTSDYYNSCWDIPSAGYSLDVPSNFNGFQIAKTGHAYAGIAAYSPLVNYREYVEIELDSVLREGVAYCISFYVNRSDASNYAINSLGMLITDTVIQDLFSFEGIVANAQVSTSSIITDTINWTEISGTYIANGGEKYITIGCFEDSGAISFIELNSYIPEWFGYAVYFIDDVTVQQCSVEPIDTLDPIDPIDPIEDSLNYTFYIPNSFSPNGDNMNSFYGPKGFGIIDFAMDIYTRWGEKIFTTNSIDKLWNGTYKEFDCPQGIYAYKVYYKFENGQEFQQIGNLNLLR